MVRKAVSDSFTKLSRLREHQSYFNDIHFFMAATCDGMFAQHAAMQRWCSATKRMLQVARRFSPSSVSVASQRRTTGKEKRDVEEEANQVIKEEAPGLTDFTTRKRDMFDEVRYAE
jgi:hypothetical protein